MLSREAHSPTREKFLLLMVIKPSNVTSGLLPEEEREQEESDKSSMGGISIGQLVQKSIPDYSQLRETQETWNGVVLDWILI